MDKALNRGYVLLPLAAPHRPPGRAGLHQALDRASSLGPLPAAVEATPRMTHEQSARERSAPRSMHFGCPDWRENRLPAESMILHVGPLGSLEGNRSALIAQSGWKVQDTVEATDAARRRSFAPRLGSYRRSFGSEARSSGSRLGPNLARRRSRITWRRASETAMAAPPAAVSTHPSAIPMATEARPRAQSTVKT